MEYQKYDPERWKAPIGKYRVMEIDISVADGFSGQMDEECGYVVGDFRAYWLALIAANYTVPDTGRFPRQIHDHTGKCLYFTYGNNHLRKLKKVLRKTRQVVLKTRGVVTRSKRKGNPTCL